MSEGKYSRREFLRNAAVTLPAGAFLMSNAASSQDLVKLATDDPTAMALGYIEDATAVDAAKYPMFKADSNCANCMQIQGADADAYRPCGIFPGKSVASAGWCSVWVAKPA
ncbi:MAG: high-potential iron-sulfur protein [Gammaproteobacteria bacterium]|jgi:hypothetical protein|nr:high-potential iron-sulfur protein [Gammaproteobacteria bacterium]